MQIFHTVLPVKETFSKDMYMAYLHQWIAGSPHYGLKEVSWKPQDGYNKTYKSETKNVTFSISDLEKECVTAARLASTDDNNLVWITDIVFNQSQHVISIWMNREAGEDVIAFSKHYKIPYFIKMLVQNDVLRKDGHLPITDEYIKITLQNCSDFESVLRKNSNNKLPVVYLSKAPNGHYLADPFRLARQLQGIAHVLVEADAHITPHLQSCCDGKNAYSGGIGIYYPGTLRRDYRFIPKYIHEDSIEYKIRDEVVEYLNQQRRLPLQTWEGIQNEKSKLKQAELYSRLSDFKAREQKTLLANKEIEELFDDQNNQLAEYEEQLDSQANKIAALELELYGLRNKLNRQDSMPLLYTGEEKELYNGEIRDVVLDVLAKANNNRHTRRNDIIDDILENNGYDQQQENRKNHIKAILDGYKRMTPNIRRDLQDFGFTIKDDSKHYKLIYFNDSRYFATMSKTGSDHRGGANLASEIINKML